MRYIVLLSLFFIPKAYAIPPPDIVMNLFQSLAGVLGIVVASCIAGFFFAKDFLKMIWHQHKKMILGSIVLIGAVGGTWGFFALQQEPEAGGYISIEEVIAQEPNNVLREWKLELLEDMRGNLDQYREDQGLSNIPYPILKSYPPRELHERLQEESNKIVLFDVREENERMQFGLDGNTISHRYADLVNDVLPNIKKDTPLVVLCYSGIRGYVAASILAHHGFTEVSYMQGGLGAWVKAKIPYRGSDEFNFLYDSYDRLFASNLERFSGTVLSFSEYNVPHPEEISDDAILFDVETMTTGEIQETIDSISTQEPAVIVCRTESSCFDAVNIAYFLEQRGLNIIGYIQIDHE